MCRKTAATKLQLNCNFNCNSTATQPQPLATRTNMKHKRCQLSRNPSACKAHAAMIKSNLIPEA